MTTKQPTRDVRTAYHESGHALVGMLTFNADPVLKISIMPPGQAVEVTFSAPDSARLDGERGEFEAKVRVALGGCCAEELAFGQPSTGDESDVQQLTETARQMAGHGEMSDRIGAIVEESRAAVLALLRENRWRLDALAAGLLKYETLEESMAYAAAGLPTPGSAPGSFSAAAFGASSAAA